MCPLKFWAISLKIEKIKDTESWNRKKFIWKLFPCMMIIQTKSFHIKFFRFQDSVSLIFSYYDQRNEFQNKVLFSHNKPTPPWVLKIEKICNKFSTTYILSLHLFRNCLLPIGFWLDYWAIFEGKNVAYLAFVSDKWYILSH